MRKHLRVVPWLVTKLFVIGAIAASLPQAARAAGAMAPPAVPPSLEVPPGNELFLVGHATGTQNYVCLPSTTGFAFALFTPQATLFDGRGAQVITHFFAPNPSENGAIRAAWQHSRDTSAVLASLAADPSTDPRFVAPGAIAWLLLQRAGVAEGPTGGDILIATSYIQRVNTAGGVAPPGCDSLADVGKKAFVPYTADYLFYRAEDGG